jgi:hypothetical protein
MNGACGGVAVFSSQQFLLLFPEFSGVDPNKLQAYFTSLATLYLSNSPNSPVCDLTRRLTFLNMLVAHISYLKGDLDAVAIAPAPASATLNVTAPTAGPFVISHGLGAVPASVDIQMTSSGAIWQASAADALNLYLEGSDVGVTADVYVYQDSQILAGNGAARPVGRTSNASEGSVSAGFDYPVGSSASAAFFAQSQYGAMFWQATSSLRGFRYAAGPSPGYPIRPVGYWFGRGIR